MLAKSAVARVRAAMNRRDAVQLRLKGKTYRQIGAALGVSDVTANKYVLDSLKKFREELAESVDEFRSIQAKRYEKMLEICWENIEVHKDGPSMDRALRIMESYNKLYPILAPQKIDAHVECEMSYNEMIEGLANGNVEEKESIEKEKMELPPKEE